MIQARRLQEKDHSVLSKWFEQSEEWLKEEGLLAIEMSPARLKVWMSLYDRYNGEWLVWFNKDGLIGFSHHILHAPSNTKPWIGMVMIAPELRRLGYGIKVLEEILRQVARSGYPIVFAGCPFDRIGWIQFLGKSGFEQIGLDVLENGRKYLKMAKPIEE
ncbi:GNAT family N-acetyltransferase [Pseudalkalibacillus sp. Hm43]|uniref:GNAT family N-acetyltransferase n=1 Tax=Pseudalkalibacillus sp. Hm43 TaxID=3450742 RepID=UPI003F426582